MKYYYSRGWSRFRKRPLDPCSESEAKDKHDKKEEYCVLVDDVDAPTAIIEIVDDFYGVCFLDECLRTYLDYQFSVKENGQLFLQMAVHREFQDETDEVIDGTIYRFETNGAARIVATDPETGEDMESKTQIDVSNNWEPLPEFGSYENLLKIERGD